MRADYLILHTLSMLMKHKLGINVTFPTETFVPCGVTSFPSQKYSTWVDILGLKYLGCHTKMNNQK